MPTVRALVFLLALTAKHTSPAVAQPQALNSTAWARLTTPERQPIACRVGWEAVPLNVGANRLRDACGLAVWIDRRVDPTAPVTLHHQPGEGIESTLRRLAATLGEPTSESGAAPKPGGKCSTRRIADAIYLGPAAEGLLTRLANRLEEIEQAPKAVRRALLARDAIAWPRLTEPSRLIISLLEEKGFEVGSAERIPHDRWDAYRLPAAPMADQLTLLLAGFDLDWRLVDQGKRVLITRVAPPTPVVAVHRLPRGRDLQLAPTQKLLGPGAELKLSSRRLILRGAVTQHAALQRLLLATPNGSSIDDASNDASPRNSGTNRPTPADTTANRWRDQRFTLRVADQPPLNVLRGLGKQLGLKIEADKETLETLQLAERVSFETKQATLDELLQKLAHAANVSLTRSGGVIRVKPSPALE